MKGSFFWVMFAAATLVGCGKSEEPAAIAPPALETPQQVAPAPVEPATVETAPAEPVASPVEPSPAKPTEAAPVVSAKPVQPAAKPVQATVKPAQTSPAPAPPPSAPSKATVAEPASAAPPSPPKPDFARGQQIYRQACAFCHDKGIAGAPKIGDPAAWSTRLAQGMDVLYTTALRGKGAMPAKGGNPALADADVKAAVDYLVAQSR